jgi:hypothetical protein
MLLSSPLCHSFPFGFASNKYKCYQKPVHLRLQYRNQCFRVVKKSKDVKITHTEHVQYANIRVTLPLLPLGGHTTVVPKMICHDAQWQFILALQQNSSSSKQTAANLQQNFRKKKKLYNILTQLFYFVRQSSFFPSTINYWKKRGLRQHSG